MSDRDLWTALNSVLNCITNNPYRVLGVLSNSPLKDRVGNQNRLAAFAKVGKDVVFPNDFESIIAIKPTRSSENITAANTALNLDKDQLKHALFWFINGSPMDAIALKHLQAGNNDKALEIFEKKETFSSLINKGVLSFIAEDFASGFRSISKVIHTESYRTELYNSLGLANLQLGEDQLSELFISELLHEIPANKLLAAASNETDHSIISKSALDGPMSVINSEVSIAKNADTKNSEASLAAGTKLMNSTKEPLKQIKELAGAQSPQYQLMADSVAKQVLQCGINYYNNAPDSDLESPRKAMVLQGYALLIAVGKLTKDRCQENYDIIKKAVDNMPPAQVAIETRKVKGELAKFCKLPDKISHSVTLLNNTKPHLQAIKRKLDASNPFYLSLSTEVVGNALYNIIEEVNEAQNSFSRIVKGCKQRGLNPGLLGDSLISTVKPVFREAWQATVLMDSFDMEQEFRAKRYNPNRQSLREMCDSLHISTYVSTPRPSTPRPSTPRTTTSTPAGTTSNTTNTSSNSNDGWGAFWVATIICAVIGAMSNGVDGFFCGAFLGAIIVGQIARAIFKE